MQQFSYYATYNSGIALHCVVVVHTTSLELRQEYCKVLGKLVHCNG